MGNRLIAALAVLVLISGCARVAESRFNPFNWFGSSEAADTLIPPGAEWGEETETAVDIPDVTAMSVDRMPGGAIVTAEGVTLTQGFWDAELVEVTDLVDVGRDTVVLDFKVERPYRRHPAGAQPTRTVSAGLFLSDAKLRGVTRIVVRGANTQRVARR